MQLNYLNVQFVQRHFMIDLLKIVMKTDNEYQHLVSLFKQKNEKLFNQLANNLYIYTY